MIMVRVFCSIESYSGSYCVSLQCMEEEFVRWMDWYGKSYGEFELMKGDFLDLEFERILQSAT